MMQNGVEGELHELEAGMGRGKWPSVSGRKWRQELKKEREGEENGQVGYVFMAPLANVDASTAKTRLVWD